MQRIIPQFKDDNDKIIVVAMIILSLFCVFIPPLIVMLCLKNYISESSYQIAKAYLNLELFLFLVSLIFIIPIIGWIVGFILCPILYIINVVIIVLNLCAISAMKELKIPVPFNFI